MQLSLNYIMIYEQPSAPAPPDQKTASLYVSVSVFVCLCTYV